MNEHDPAIQTQGRDLPNPMPPAPPSPFWLAKHWAEALTLPLLPPPTHCLVVGCDRPATIRGLCRNHYRNAQTAFDKAFREKRGRSGKATRKPAKQ